MANNWRGCKDVFMQGHGEWADPDIYIENEDGLFVFNYWDIEEALWGDFLESEGIEEKDTYDERGNISDEWEEKFSEYCRNNAYDYITYDLLPEGGYFTDEQCSKDGTFCSWHTDDVKEYDAEQEDDEDDYDYDDVDESCSGGKKKKKKLKESTSCSIISFDVSGDQEDARKIQNYYLNMDGIQDATTPEYIDYRDYGIDDNTWQLQIFASPDLCDTLEKELQSVVESNGCELLGVDRYPFECDFDESVENKNKTKIDEATGPEPNDYAKKAIEDARKVGLWNYLDDHMLNFCFNGPEELKRNANKIRKWMKLYPDYFICKEPADAYGEDSEDGYLYFVSDMDDVPKEERMNIDSFENGFYESVSNNRKKKVNETMGGWKIKLRSGKSLRNAIDSEDKVAVLEALKDCWEEIHKKMPDYYDESDLSNDIDDIDNQIDNAENYEEYDMTEEDVEDEVNYLLDQFYDFCDNARVWVELD